MLRSLFKILTAAAIAFGVVAWVTNGDFSKVVSAAQRAGDKAMERKREQEEIKAIAAAQEDAPPAREGPKPIPVVTTVSVAQPMADTLTLTGRTEAEARVEIRAETGGIVSESPRRRGDRILAGDLLCRLDIGDRQARRAQAEAQLRQARVSEDAQSRLSERGFAAQNRAVEAQANADAARASIRQIDIDILRTEMRAPIDGVIDGSPAQIGALLQPGSLCATIIDPDPMLVVGFVQETQVGALRVGQTARATLVGGQSVSGEVRYIAPAADPATRTFQVDIAVPNPGYSLREGVTAQITLPLQSATAHKLPQSALTLSDAGEIGVKVAERGRAVFVPVRILRDDSDGLWATGLGERADVITIGQEFVTDGTLVLPTDAATLEAMQRTAGDRS